MRKILLSIILFFATISSAVAQKLTVESFKLAPSDLTAQTQPRKDLNNRNCAVVKVQFVGELTNIEGNVIMPLVKRNNETWVYMPQNTRQMKVITKNYLPLMVTFADYDIERLESNRTYVLTLLGSSQQQAQQIQTLTIRYSPTTSTVLVDNKMVNGSNGVAQTTLPVGQHSYIVACNGYESEEGTVKLKATAPSNLQITLSKEASALATTIQHVVPQRTASASIGSSSSSIATQTTPYKFTGKVVDINGEPIIGASIFIKKTICTVSDIDGNFVLKADSPTLNGVVKYIGFKDKEVTLNAEKHEHIVLK